MARDDSSVSRQLTLDDWAEMLNARRKPRDAAQRDELSGETLASVGPADEARSAQATFATRHPAATELLKKPGALLTRTHLRELGLERRAIDAVFRKLPVVSLPGYSRPMIHAEQYLELIDAHTYRDDRVRPSHA